MGNADYRVGVVGGGPTVHPGVLVAVGKGEADTGGELDGEEGVRSVCVNQGANAVAEDGGVDVEERGEVNWTLGNGHGFVIIVGGGGPGGGRGRGGGQEVECEGVEFRVGWLGQGGEGMKLWGVTRRLLGAFGAPVGAPAGEAPCGGWVGGGGRAEESGGGRWGGGGNKFGGGECGCAGVAGDGGGLHARRDPASIVERLDDAGRCVEIGGALAVDFLARLVLESLEELKVGLLSGEALDAKEQGGEGSDVLLGGSGLSQVSEGLPSGEGTIGGAELGIQGGAKPVPREVPRLGRVGAAAAPPQLGSTREGSGGRAEAVGVDGDVGVGEVFLKVP